MLGTSLGKIVDLNNAVNIVSCLIQIHALLQLLEEYEAYTVTKNQLFDCAVLNHIMPQQTESFSQRQANAEKRQQVQKDYRESLIVERQILQQSSAAPNSLPQVASTH